MNWQRFITWNGAMMFLSNLTVESPVMINWYQANADLDGSAVNLMPVWLFLHTGATAGEPNSRIRAAGPLSSAAAPQTMQSASKTLQRFLAEERRHSSLWLWSPSAKLATPLETLGMSWSSSTLKTSAGETAIGIRLGAYLLFIGSKYFARQKGFF